MRPATRALLVLSLLLNVVAVTAAVVVGTRVGWSTVLDRAGVVEAPRPDMAALAEQRFEGLPGAGVAVVGDSQVRLGAWSELVQAPVAVRGVDGARVDEVAGWVGGSLDDPDLEQLVLWAGTNDLLAGRSPGQVAEDLGALVREARAEREDVEIVVLGMPPLRGLEGEAREATVQISERVGASGAVVVPVDDALAPPGRMHQDGVHLSPAGYVEVGRLLTELGVGEGSGD